METISSILVLLVGLLIRLAVPIAMTVILIFLLRKLDARWQKEANSPTLVVQKPECWKTKGCSPEQIACCTAAKSPLPCWQVSRLPNGYLREECLACNVFIQTPMPKLQTE